MHQLRQLFADTDDAVRPLAVARPLHQHLEVELFWILASLSQAPDVSVSARSTRSKLLEFAARKIR